MNWYNIDLNSHEIGSNLIEPLTFETLLLEINCNIKDINRNTVRKQFEADLQSRIRESRDIFNKNLDNLVKKALDDRQD